MSKKVLIVVQCRFSSARLPGKAVYPVAGLPMVAFLLRRLRGGLSEDRYRVVLATTKLPQDDAVTTWGEAEGVAVFRGEEQDVLSRYVQCLAKHPADTVVRVTADNPLTCPEAIAQLVRVLEENQADYGQCLNLPYGAGSDAFSSGILEKLQRVVTEADEREHINLHILRHPEIGRTVEVAFNGELARSDLRMTVDTKEDWQRVKSLFRPSDVEPWQLSLREAIARLDRLNIP